MKIKVVISLLWWMLVQSMEPIFGLPWWTSIVVIGVALAYLKGE